MDPDHIASSYARWAPIYDLTFGAAMNRGRRRAMDHINARAGSVLEVGVGTGLTLGFYGPQMRVTGIDFSEDMLAKAKARVTEQSLSHVEALHQMDARRLAFPDDHFDTVTAMHVLSVVPEPERVVSEMARVCKPGGQIVITNHFARDRGVLAALERIAAPLENLIGWHADFGIDRVLGDPRLSETLRQPNPPLGLMTLLVLTKD